MCPYGEFELRRLALAMVYLERTYGTLLLLLSGMFSVDRLSIVSIGFLHILVLKENKFVT